MPSFYPGGPTDILAGNQDEQIRAMRDYIFWFGTHPGETLPGQVAEVPAKVSNAAPTPAKVAKVSKK